MGSSVSSSPELRNDLTDADHQEQLAHLEAVGRAPVDIELGVVVVYAPLVHPLGADDLDIGQELAGLMQIERAVEVCLVDQLVGLVEDLGLLDVRLLDVLGEGPSGNGEHEADDKEDEPPVKRRFSAHGHTSWPTEFHRVLLYVASLATVNIQLAPAPHGQWASIRIK